MDTYIYSPRVSAGATLPAAVDFDLTWSADVISSASVDVTTAATPTISEKRQELSVAFAREAVALNIDATGMYAYSFEQDADSHIFDVGGTRGFNQDNWIVGVKYNLSLNRVGLRDQAKSDWRKLSVHGVDLSLSRLLDPRTVAEVRYSFYYIDGFQASPYRRVPIIIGGDLVGATWVDEQAPNKRTRHALTLRSRRALSKSWVGAAEYRLYFDDWGLMAHTVKADQAWDLGAGLAVRMQQRLGYQGGADFYQNAYTEMLRYRTRDRRLSPHLNALVGANVLYEIGKFGAIGTLEAFVSADLIAWRYNEFSKPVVTTTGSADLEPLGTILGGVMQIGLQSR